MLAERYEIRPLTVDDGPALAAAYRRNREHLRPWDPDRPEGFDSDEAQVAEVAQGVAAAEEGRSFAFPFWYGDLVVGRAMLTHVVRGPLQSGTVGYWVDRDHLGRGLATAGVEHVVGAATALGLHRLEAGTMPDNLASQAVLRRCGFEEYGTAERFLFIRGAWRDHVLFQRILHDEPPGNPAG